MDKRLKVKKSDLEKTKDDWDYLYVILNKYQELSQADSVNFLDNLNDNQLALFGYRILDAQVTNGGFLQLIYNGYAPYAFENTFIQTLRLWGAASTADLLELVKPAGLQVAEKLQSAGQFGEQRNMDAFSDLYKEYPEFDKYDDKYYEINKTELRIVKDYVAHNLSDFILVE